MKSFIVFSDIHGNYGAMEKLLPLINENDGAIFAGDGLNVVFAYRRDIKSVLYAVRGNCDDGCGQSELVIECEKVKILLTHGDSYGVRYSLSALADRAKELGCSVAIFGHTHEPTVILRDGVKLINPGTCNACCAEKTFCYLSVNGEKVSAFINTSALNNNQV